MANVCEGLGSKAWLMLIMGPYLFDELIVEFVINRHSALKLLLQKSLVWRICKVFACFYTENCRLKSNSVQEGDRNVGIG